MVVTPAEQLRRLSLTQLDQETEPFRGHYAASVKKVTHELHIKSAAEQGVCGREGGIRTRDLSVPNAPEANSPEPV